MPEWVWALLNPAKAIRWARCPDKRTALISNEAARRDGKVRGEVMGKLTEKDLATPHPCFGTEAHQSARH